MERIRQVAAAAALASLLVLAGCAPSLSFGPAFGAAVVPGATGLQLSVDTCGPLQRLSMHGGPWSVSQTAGDFRMLREAARVQARYSAGYSAADARRAQSRRLAAGEC